MHLVSMYPRRESNKEVQLKLYGRTIFPLLILFPLFTACADTPETSSIDQLSPEQIAALAEEYPRLTADEPLPPPQPNGTANPSQIPDRLASTVPGKVLETITGEATFYAQKFEGRRTASGIPFRQNQMVAAHRAYPFGTVLRVTNTGNDRSVTVRVVDRGPFGSSARAQRTVLDLSTRAAEQLGYIQAGRAQVRVEVLQWGRGVSDVVT